ncbi:MAG: hypothetical protein M1834_000513 [Cirrosporium novae-zelandiae]|nr:MAG: hypothetical protein M1834_000513 [Cirrosporium novae-zelandiae]
MSSSKESWNIYTIWIGLYLLATALSFDAQTVFSFQSYAISFFDAHSMLGTVTTIQNIVYAVGKAPVARFADLYGRLLSFAVFTVIITIGFIILASSPNAMTFSAGQISYTLGQVGLQFMETIFIADTTSLENRTLGNAMLMSPFLFTTWLGSIIVAKLVPDHWRLGYAMWAVIVPLISLPLLIALWRKSRETMVTTPKRRTTPRSFKAMISRFDAIGLSLFTGGLTLILIPISVSARYIDRWTSPSVLAMLITGIVSVIAFPIYELHMAKHPVLSFQLAKSTSVAASCGVSFCVFCSFYIYQPYFFSYLLVAQNFAVEAANNITLAQTFTSTIVGLVVGFAAKRTGRFKKFALMGGVMKILGGILMLSFRKVTSSTVQLVIAQMVMGMGVGGIMTTNLTGLQATVPRQDVAAATALQATLSSVGGAVGDAISGAIWSHQLPPLLTKYLPAESRHLVPKIRDSILVALSYPPGSPERVAIAKAYDEVMHMMLIVSLVVACFPFFLLMLVQNVDLIEADKLDADSNVVDIVRREYEPLLDGEPRRRGSDSESSRSDGSLMEYGGGNERMDRALRRGLE